MASSPLSLLGSGIGVFDRASITVRASDPVRTTARHPQELRALERLEGDLRSLRAALERLARHADVTRGRSRSQAAAVSAVPLDLPVVAATPTTLSSSEEVNTTPTSFTPFGPAVSGSSTTLPTIAGIYDGGRGDDVWTFSFRRNAEVGSGERLRVRVSDGAGQNIANLNFRFVDVDEPVALPNGLTLALGAGDAVRNDTFQLAVSASVGSAVDPAKPFDGTRNQQPNLEPGLSVTAGSFEVNGVVISVAANDAIDSVLAKINAADAGVDALFDAASERVVLTQRTAGSAGRVIVGADSSGFLAAVKLGSASEVPGQDGGDALDAPIASIPSLAAISTGSFDVNEATLGVDPPSDSLSAVLDRINASGAGARATLDPETRRVAVLPTPPRRLVELGDGSSGLFSALQIAPGSYAARARRGGLQFSRPDDLRREIGELGRAVAALQNRGDAGLAGGELAAIREQIGAAMGEAFGALGEPTGASYRTGLGLDWIAESGGGGRLHIDSQRLRRALSQRAGELQSLLFETKGSEGLVGGVRARLDTLQTQLADRIGRARGVGRLLDIRV